VSDYYGPIAHPVPVPGAGRGEPRRTTVTMALARLAVGRRTHAAPRSSRTPTSYTTSAAYGGATTI
jgi:hypothetical protein